MGIYFVLELQAYAVLYILLIKVFQLWSLRTISVGSCVLFYNTILDFSTFLFRDLHATLC